MPHLVAHPRFSLGTVPGFGDALGRAAGLASELGIGEVDLVADRVSRRTAVRSLVTAANAPDALLGRIWVNPNDLGSVARRAAAADPLGGKQELELVVMLEPGKDARTDQAIIASAWTAASRLPAVPRLIIGLPAAAPEGGKLHLQRVRLVRRLAEEWGAGLALDLSTDTDAAWEAEAIVQLIGSSLTAVRLRGSLIERSGRHVEIHRRALRACADSGFHGTIVLVPTTPVWLRWHSSTVLADLSVNRDAAERLLVGRTLPHRATQRAPR